MSLKDDLTNEVAQIFREHWSSRDGTVVPESSNLKLSNDAVKLDDAVVLYADIDGSTDLVDKEKHHFSAEIYKSFLHCAAKVIRAEGGQITAYDGDRIMAVFVGNVKNTPAARAALKINYGVKNIINPGIRKQYSASTFVLRHTVGIDRSSLFVSRTGVRGANDLVWVGRAANHAAKLCTLTSDYPTAITKEVFDGLQPELKESHGKPIWEAWNWNAMGRSIYRSQWTWEI